MVASITNRTSRQRHRHEAAANILDLRDQATTPTPNDERVHRAKYIKLDPLRMRRSMTLRAVWNRLDWVERCEGRVDTTSTPIKHGYQKITTPADPPPLSIAITTSSRHRRSYRGLCVEHSHCVFLSPKLLTVHRHSLICSISMY